MVPVPPVADTAPERPERRVALDADGIRLAHRIARRLDGRRTADAATLRAVTVLTDSADPARARRLRPGVGEPAALVERLAVWAMFEADDVAVDRAHGVLDEAAHTATLAA